MVSTYATGPAELPVVSPAWVSIAQDDKDDGDDDEDDDEDEDEVLLPATADQFFFIRSQQDLQAKPNPLALLNKEGGVGGIDGEAADDGDGLYKPPKLAAVPFDEGGGSRKERNRARALERASSTRMVRELRIAAAPSARHLPPHPHTTYRERCREREREGEGGGHTHTHTHARA